MFDLGFIFRGILFGPSVFVLGRIMDNLFCKKEVQFLKDSNKELYKEAMNKIQINLTVLSTFLYLCITPLFVNYDKNKTDIEYMKLLGLVILQNIGYYYGHYLMHHTFYSIHSFHHKFDKHISSSIAFAVSIEEFLFAYITPLMIGSCILYPNENTFVSATALIAIFNLIIHTPSFKTEYYPSLFVSPKDHLEHHEKKKIHYAAPIFSIDKILLFIKK
jgi:sterol desaturase/sphingolipid hydroxylase (fatty acid hydroxylase superfamily)